MLLDEGILEVEGFLLGIDDSILQVGDVAHEHGGAQRSVFAVEVGVDASLEILGLTHIDNRALAVAVAVHARLVGEQRQLELEVVSH